MTNLFKIKKSKLVIFGFLFLIIIALAFLLSNKYVQLQLAEFGIGKSVVVEGVVADNNWGCAADGVCVLKVDLGRQKVDVIYGTGGWSSQCESWKAAQIGFEFVEGDKLVAYGEVLDKDTISICSSKDYYIKRAQ